MGNIWMFSDLIDEVDLRFARHEFITYKMASDYYGLSIKVVTNLAWKCGAVYKVHKNVLIRRDIFEACLRERQRKGAANEA